MNAKAVGWACAILIAAGAGGAVWYHFARGDLGFSGSGGKIIATFEGGEFVDGFDSKSEPFTVEPDWEIVVKGRGEFQFIGVYRFGFDSEPYISNRPTGRYETFVDELKHRGYDGGKYYINVMGKGKWKATIIQHSGRP